MVGACYRCGLKLGVVMHGWQIVVPVGCGPILAIGLLHLSLGPSRTAHFSGTAAELVKRLG
jgi:hypothetical protein